MIGLLTGQIDPKHLANGENPPSYFSGLFANLLPLRTIARSASLPMGPLSLFPVTQDIYNPFVHGSHWQRVINDAALSTELIHRGIQESFHSSFLEYPGFTRNDLSVIYRVSLLNTTTGVLAVSANLTPTLLSGQFNSDGTPKLDPNRPVSINMLEATNVFDFYYGLSFTKSFVSDGVTTAFQVDHKIGINEDGTSQIEWVTVNGTTTNAFSISNNDTIILNTAPVAGASIVIHYTTYDVYYLLNPDKGRPVIYFRKPYAEVFLTLSGDPIVSDVKLLPITSVPFGTTVVTPTVYNRWNELDEISLYLNRRRQPGESNADFQQRLIDTVLYRSDATRSGLRNALATDLGLVSHDTWTVQDGLTKLIGHAHLDTILINRKPLAYYTVSSPASAGKQNICVQVPALDPGDVEYVSVPCVSSDGPIVPELTPFTVTLNLPSSAMGIYDEIDVSYKQTLFGTPSNAWYPGTLNVWKNGVALTRGQDFTETSNTTFRLTSFANPGDKLQLGYVYSSFIDIPSLEAQADIETDLAPVIRVSASITRDAIVAGSYAFPGWNSTPPGVSIDAVAANAGWNIVFRVVNSGLLASSPFSITVNLPVPISYDGTSMLTASPAATALSSNMDIQWIDADSVWVNSLVDDDMHDYLYDAQGNATSLLHIFAERINNISPIEFGDVVWDRGLWQSIHTNSDPFSYIPHTFDANYATYLDPVKLYYTGALSGARLAQLPIGLFGTSIFGQITFGASATAAGPFTVDYTSPGSIFGESNIVRYPDFQSGIGDEDDLAVTTDVTSDMWLAQIQPGNFYLNQEEKYYFANPVFAEVVDPTYFMTGAVNSSPVIANYYDANGKAIAMRRVYFYDQNGLPTLTVTETLQASAGNLYTQYADLVAIKVLASSDGVTYTTASTASSNVVTLNASTSATITISYQLNGSFYVTNLQPNGFSPLQGGLLFVMEQTRLNGVLVTYETGTDKNISDMPLHPYYVPRSSGFLYVGDNFVVPATVEIWSDPQSLPADGVSLFTIKIRVLSSNGRGVPNLPVQLIIAFRDGNHTYAQVTDEFGMCYCYFNAPATPQTTQISASVTLFDQQATPLQTISDMSYIEFYASN